MQVSEWEAGNGSKSGLHEVFMGCIPCKEGQACCIPCKVDCSLHLTGCTNCIVPCPIPPLTLTSHPPFPSPTSLTTPSIFPSPLLPPFHPPALQIVSKITLYCRASPQSRLHLSVHIPDCEKAAEEPEGEAGGDRGPTFSWENNYVGDQKENEDNCTFVLEKTP